MKLIPVRGRKLMLYKKSIQLVFSNDNEINPRKGTEI